jgi:hypothetical protein
VNGLPRYWENSHALQGAWRMPVHVYAALCHGHAPKVFLVPDHVKQGVNITVEVLQRSLRQLEEDGVPLPPTLYLQLDNTAKQNKSRFLFAYLGELLKMGIFQHIYVSFLPVGHTHEDIDQIFSRFSIAMLMKDTVTMADMSKIFEGAFTTREGHHPQVSTITAVANISDHVDSKTKHWASLGVAQYYQFHLFMKGAMPHIRARESTTGLETFRGLFKSSRMSCTDSNSIFEEEEKGVGIVWGEIEPAQRRVTPDETSAEYHKTIMKVLDFKGLSNGEFGALCAMYNLVRATEPIPFHWSEPLKDSTHGKPLLPFKNTYLKPSSVVLDAAAGSVALARALSESNKHKVGADCESELSSEVALRVAAAKDNYERSDIDEACNFGPEGAIPGASEADSDADVALVRKPVVNLGDMTAAKTKILAGVPGGALASRGPGSLDNNPFNPVEVQRRRQTEPLYPFELNQIVIIEPEFGTDNNNQGFWIGKLVATPLAGDFENRKADKTYVGVHWYDRKRTKRTNVLWNAAKFVAQTTEVQSQTVDFIEAVEIDVVGCNILLNKDGSISKTPAWCYAYVNYWRKQWFRFDADPK